MREGAVVPHGTGAFPCHGGAWTLMSATSAPALSPAAVAAALHALRQQQGGSSLLRGVPAAAEAAPGAKGGGQGDTPRTLLAAAAPLGLLSAARATGSVPSALGELLLHRDAELAAAAAGDAPGFVPLPLPPAVPDWPEGADWGGGGPGQAGGSSTGPGAHSGSGSGGHAAQADDSADVQRQWEAERDAALGLPQRDTGGPLSHRDSHDVLAGGCRGPRDARALWVQPAGVCRRAAQQFLLVPAGCKQTGASNDVPTVHTHLPRTRTRRARAHTHTPTTHPPQHLPPHPPTHTCAHPTPSIHTRLKPRPALLAAAGRPLSWEYPVLFAAADGSCATAELQPEAFNPGSATAWQATYAAATPMGGQPWKRLRVA